MIQMVHAERSINVIHRSKLRYVEFILAAGDLFDADVDAIVNSEQSDFILSKNPDTVSGQIWSRYGIPVQRELDAECFAPGRFSTRPVARISSEYSMPRFTTPTIGLTG